MPTTPDDTKTLRTRLLPSQRTLVMILCIGLVAVTAAGTVAQSESYDMRDTFEDGNTRIEYDGWNGWDRDLNASTTDVIDGSYSGRLTGPSGTTAEREANTTAVQEVKFDVLIDKKTTPGNSRDASNYWVEDNNGNSIARVSFAIFNDGSTAVDTGAAGQTILSSWDNDTVYTVRYYDWNFTSGEVNITVTGGGDSGTITESFSTSNRFGQIRINNLYDSVGGSMDVSIDNVQVQSAARYAIGGRVTDQDGDAIRDGLIQATDGDGNTFNTDLNRTGHYSIEGLENDTYTVETKVPDYLNESASVTIDGTGATQDFQLLNKDDSLDLDVRKFVEHGQSVPYEVTATYIDNGQRVREEVTADAIVTSNNTTIVTVDEVNKEVVGTSDVSVNARTYVQANWTAPSGDTYTDRVNVTVANKTVANFGILPTWSRVSATVSSGTARVIFIATATGAAVAIIATSFAGLGALTMVMIAGWILGYVNDGTVIATVLVVTFVGLNVAGNVDYTVRKG